MSAQKGKIHIDFDYWFFVNKCGYREKTDCKYCWWLPKLQDAMEKHFESVNWKCLNVWLKQKTWAKTVWTRKNLLVFKNSAKSALSVKDICKQFKYNFKNTHVNAEIWGFDGALTGSLFVDGFFTGWVGSVSEDFLFFGFFVFWSAFEISSEEKSVVLMVGSWFEDNVFWSGTLLERSIRLGFEGAGSELVWNGEPIVTSAWVDGVLVKVAAGTIEDVGTVIVECADKLDMMDVESDMVESVGGWKT